PTFSPTEDKVVFVKISNSPTGVNPETSSIEAINLLDNSDSITTILPFEKIIRNIQFSKDGEHLFYQNDAVSLNIINLDDSSKSSILKLGSGDIQGFSASPDGTQIVYSSNISGNYELYILTISSKEITQITNTSEDEVHPFWN
ncbi:MAG: PD40 domain-containing protein, partial [Flavobacteriales bacterium]|nr:PD40 domain-containing protein [Flavobacteriales bacterium]